MKPCRSPCSRARRPATTASTGRTTGSFWHDFPRWVRATFAGHTVPFHRVDVRRSSQAVRVSLGDQALAEACRPRLLSETGLANRLYIPPEDVRRDRLTVSGIKALCP
jgi:uncharacterized protein (DUF427 family)